MKARRSNRWTSCSFLRSAPCSGGISFLGSRSFSNSTRHVLGHQQLEPVEKLGRGRLLLHAGHVADFVEDIQAPRATSIFWISGKWTLMMSQHRVPVGELDVVEETAAQERVGQFLFIVRGDDHQRAVGGLDHLAGFIDIELHAVEFLQQIVRELDIRLVDLVDQQNGRGLGRERLPQLAAFDVVGDVADPLVTELGIAQPRRLRHIHIAPGAPWWST